uniref:Uncharacterized protein n=1 Tax=Ciona savignyi TaxID=51511 RepID=H2YD00_CIOSA
MNPSSHTIALLMAQHQALMQQQHQQQQQQSSPLSTQQQMMGNSYFSPYPWQLAYADPALLRSMLCVQAMQNSHVPSRLVPAATASWYGSEGMQQPALAAPQWRAPTYHHDRASPSAHKPQEQYKPTPSPINSHTAPVPGKVPYSIPDAHRDQTDDRKVIAREKEEALKKQKWLKAENVKVEPKPEKPQEKPQEKPCKSWPHQSRPDMTLRMIDPATYVASQAAHLISEAANRRDLMEPQKPPVASKIWQPPVDDAPTASYSPTYRAPTPADVGSKPQHGVFNINSLKYSPPCQTSPKSEFPPTIK